MPMEERLSLTNKALQAPGLDCRGKSAKQRALPGVRSEPAARRNKVNGIWVGRAERTVFPLPNLSRGILGIEEPSCGQARRRSLNLPHPPVKIATTSEGFMS
jgi:hypothetical protein